GGRNSGTVRRRSSLWGITAEPTIVPCGIIDSGHPSGVILQAPLSYSGTLSCFGPRTDVPIGVLVHGAREFPVPFPGTACDDSRATPGAPRTEVPVGKQSTHSHRQHERHDG